MLYCNNNFNKNKQQQESERFFATLQLQVCVWGGCYKTSWHKAVISASLLVQIRIHKLGSNSSKESWFVAILLHRVNGMAATEMLLVLLTFKLASLV